MWTAWHSPSSLTQLETHQIPYTDSVGVLDTPRDITTVRPVVGNSRTGGGLIATEANSVLFTGFGFVLGSSTVQQVQIRLTVGRVSRIQDRVVQLYYITPQGTNLADPAAGDEHVYTHAAVPGIAYDSADFGCVIDLAAHRHYPSSNNIVIRSVHMRLML